MDDRHVIEQAVFDIRFDSEERAWAEQDGLGIYVKSGLMPVIDKIFGEFSQPEVNLSFDLLEIDLGIVNYDSHRDELSNRLREQLRESLARLIPAESADGGPRLETAGQRDLSLLRFFLERGHLPWHAGAAETGRMEETLLRLLRGRDSGFLRFLAGTAKGEKLLARVVSQFSEAVLNELAAALRSFPQDVPMSLSDNTPQMEQELPPTLIKKPVAEGAAAELFPAELSLRIGHALEEGDASWLSSAWPELCLEYPRSMLEKLRRHGRSAFVRRRIAERFPESAIKEILLLLEPGEAPFIDGVTGSPELFRCAALSDSDGGNRTRRRLWEFTLGYLLEERGSLFNRRAYMASLATSTAAYAGLELKELLADMKQVLESFPAAAPLKQELSGILDGLEEEVASQRPSAIVEPGSSAETTKARESAFLIDEPLISGSLRELAAFAEEVATEPGVTLLHADAGSRQMGLAVVENLVRELRRAFLRGTPQNMADVWIRMLQASPQPLLLELRRHGADAALRKRIAGNFSETMLREAVALLEPGEIPFIEELAARLELFRQASLHPWEGEDELKKRLWECTLEFLLEERGRRFNRKTYLNNLVRRMVMRDGAEGRGELLLAMHGMLSTLAASTPFIDEVLELIERLCAGTELPLPLAVEEQSQPDAGSALGEIRLRIGKVLLRGTSEDQSLIRTEFLRDHSQLLCEELRKLGQWVAVRRRIAERFSEETLRELVLLLEPVGKGFIEQLAGLRELFAGAGVGPTPLTNRSLSGVEGKSLHVVSSTIEGIGADIRESASAFAPPYLPLEGGGTQGSKSALWEFTLGYLLEDRGSSFNKKSYLGSLIKHMATRDNLGFTALLKALHGALANAGPADAFHGELLSLIDELLAEASDGAVTDEPEKSGSDAHPANALTERLRRLLIPESGALPARTGELKGMLHNFAEHQPEQLAQFFRELASGGTFLFTTKGFYAAEELRRMIELFLLLVHAVEPEKLANFLGALDQWSTRSGDAGRFLEQVFELLIQNRPVDCEALVIGSELSGLAQTTDGADAMPRRCLPAAKAPDTSTVWRLDDEPGDFSDQIYIDNAGLVLAAPYLPQLFSMLGLLDKQAFVDDAAAGRCVHLLQYMADKVIEASEPLLVLNKILCGVKPETPVPFRIGIEAREMEIVEGLIKGMIGNWNVLGAITTDSFRDSFLRREGVLRMKEDGWHLMVEPKAYDLLLDRIPWSFSVIRHPWMPQAVHVEWRHGL